MSNNNEIKLSKETADFLMSKIPNLPQKELEILKEYFVLDVIGVMASRDLMCKEYPDFCNSKKSIIDFFAEKKGIDVSKLEEWKAQLQTEIDRIRSSAISERQEGFKDRKDFLRWYLSEPKKCCYCGIEEKDLKAYFSNDNKQGGKAIQRGRGEHLEIERVDSESAYSPENTKLACYICNNAKSDFFNANNFKPIAKGINEFWKNWLKKDIEFPDKSNIWNK